MERAHVLERPELSRHTGSSERMKPRESLGICALLALLSAGSGANAGGCWLELHDDARKVSGAWWGSCEGDKAYGYGAAEFADGGTYLGDAQGGRAHGSGKVVDAQGDRYEGGFADGRRHGIGTASSPEGGRVTGRWDRGKLVKVSESTVSPESEEAHSGGTGAQDGAVTEDADRAAASAAGCKLQFGGRSVDWRGPCKDGMAQGEGRATASDGSAYAGSARNGKPDGHGTIHAPDGGYYQGGFRNGLHHGWATLRTADGRTWRAEFRDGEQVGKSILMEGVAGNDRWKDAWKEETGQSDLRGQENGTTSDSGAAEADLAGSRPSDSDQGGDADYRAALESLEGGDRVVRVAIPDEYTAELTELERQAAERRAAEMENESRRSAEEALRKSEEEAAERRQADRETERSRRRAALDEKAHEAWESEREEARRRSKRRMEFTQRTLALQREFNAAMARCDEIEPEDPLVWCPYFKNTGRSGDCRTIGPQPTQSAEKARRACRHRAKSEYQSALQELTLSNPL